MSSSDPRKMSSRRHPASSGRGHPPSSSYNFSSPSSSSFSSGQQGPQYYAGHPAHHAPTYSTHSRQHPAHYDYPQPHAQPSYLPPRQRHAGIAPHGASLSAYPTQSSFYSPGEYSMYHAPPPRQQHLISHNTAYPPNFSTNNNNNNNNNYTNYMDLGAKNTLIQLAPSKRGAFHRYCPPTISSSVTALPKTHHSMETPIPNSLASHDDEPGSICDREGRDDNHADKRQGEGVWPHPPLPQSQQENCRPRDQLYHPAQHHSNQQERQPHLQYHHHHHHQQQQQQQDFPHLPQESVADPVVPPTSSLQENASFVTSEHGDDKQNYPQLKKEVAQENGDPTISNDDSGIIAAVTHDHVSGNCTVENEILTHPIKEEKIESFEENNSLGREESVDAPVDSTEVRECDPREGKRQDRLTDDKSSDEEEEKKDKDVGSSCHEMESTAEIALSAEISNATGNATSTVPPSASRAPLLSEERRPLYKMESSAKRSRGDEVNMDDDTPKARGYNCHTEFNFGENSPSPVRILPSLSSASGPERSRNNGVPYPSKKRSKLSTDIEYDSASDGTIIGTNSKFKIPYNPNRGDGGTSYHRPVPLPPSFTSRIRPIPSPTLGRSFSLDSIEDRQDKNHGRYYGQGVGSGREYDDQYDRHSHPLSYSPSSSVNSRGSYDDFYRRRTYSEESRRMFPADKEDRLGTRGGDRGCSFEEQRIEATFSQSHSMTEYPEPAPFNYNHSRSMSWEVPPALSTICSFGQLNNEVMKSPRESPEVRAFNEDDVEDDELPPLPGEEVNNSLSPRKHGFSLLPRPSNKMLDTGPQKSSPGRIDDNRMCFPQPPVPRDRYSMPYNRDRSPPRYPPISNYHDDRYYERNMYHKKSVDRRQTFKIPARVRRRDMDDRRDPYESHRYNFRYDDHNRHRSPPPSQREPYSFYDGGTPEGAYCGSRSFDSRSMGDLEEPMSSLLYRPSFSWERGLDMPYADSMECIPSDSNIMIELKDQQKVMKALAIRNEIRTIGNPHNTNGLILLLAMANDRHCLSETLCIIRNNVEVFTATEADINAPAPGRKRPVQVGQVGLRCVYCRMCHNDRVKRAICFPSSMKRIYRAVIDMKLDHFTSCPFVPAGLKDRLEELSAGSTRSTGMTVQYFVKSAIELGMVDMNDGVYIDLNRVGKEKDIIPHNPLQVERGLSLGDSKRNPPKVSSLEPSASASTNRVKFEPSGGPAEMKPLDPNVKIYHGKVLLSLPDDASFLSPLRCFLRRNVSVFTATARDIAVRTPTTFSVRVGQVGVGCVHCLTVPPKSRSNRAVCFPFTLARIYQSVADIQRFHLGECRMMPPEVRAEFLKLQSESAKGSRGLATRTYWIDSAKKIGLADGPAGMYFCRDPSLPPASDAQSLDILAQVATNVNSSCKPLVTPEDKPTIADFLYAVMEQLQPCRFTDADRNKRRSKNLGSIGVECKHCAGKIDGRKFFWSSVSAAESNFVSVHSHMMDCKYIPDELKTELAWLKTLRREQTSRLRTGSQKAFFTRVWNRLHIEESKDESNQSTSTVSEVLSSAAKLETSFTNASVTNEAIDDSIDLPTGGSQDEIRALLESKSTLSSMSSGEEIFKAHANESCDTPNVQNEQTDANLNIGKTADSFGNMIDIESKSSLGSVAHELSTVSVRSKERTQN